MHGRSLCDSVGLPPGMSNGPTTDAELPFWQQRQLVAGIDEAGRGALAGPVVAAAVVLHPHGHLEGVNDSKILSAVRRTALEGLVKAGAHAWATSFVWQDVIDEINILQSTYRAMHEAVDALTADVHHLLVDGNRFRSHAIPHTCLVRGDARCLSIAAASILAKVARDAWMVTVAHERWPMYGFDRHKGYGTAMHREAIKHHGPCEIHRRTFLTKL